MVEVLVKRIFKEKNFVEGHMYIDDQYMCDTLEPQYRDYYHGEVKVWGKSCIPAGSYRILYLWSKKRGRLMPTLDKVHNFVGVQIHVGNCPQDTQGCILVGTRPKGVHGFLEHSRLAFGDVDDILYRAWIKSEDINITIIEDYAEV